MNYGMIGICSTSKEEKYFFCKIYRIKELENSFSEGDFLKISDVAKCKIPNQYMKHFDNLYPYIQSSDNCIYGGFTDRS